MHLTNLGAFRLLSAVLFSSDSACVCVCVGVDLCLHANYTNTADCVSNNRFPISGPDGEHTLHKNQFHYKSFREGEHRFCLNPLTLTLCECTDDTWCQRNTEPFPETTPHTHQRPNRSCMNGCVLWNPFRLWSLR